MSECSLIIYRPKVRMSIKKTGIRALAAFFLITATAHTAPAGISAHSPDAGRTVRVGILSKPLRLLREGEIAPIVLIFPEGTRLEDESGRGSAAVRKASPVPSSGGWSLATDAGVFEGRFSLVMDTPGADRSFEVRVGNERRRYPLPLAIRSGAGDLELIITESLSRYALDAGRAEYGPVPAHAEEALYALALLIDPLRRPGRAHNGYDACDLAHCRLPRIDRLRRRKPVSVDPVLFRAARTSTPVRRPHPGRRVSAAPERPAPVSATAWWRPAPLSAAPRPGPPA